ncbi:hypothetical protein [Bacillus amyloliquefaciens]|uniref:hypothetical protein n=1 Tax=Bacillus amyloliquefaciens TaxID=1390 RepID=UPI002E0A56B3|nr:hypothetical protein [Bacillus amyloliquefaciens]
MSGIGKPSYEEVKQWVMLDPCGNGIMSMSILQRRFRIGYVNKPSKDDLIWYKELGIYILPKNK